MCVYVRVSVCVFLECIHPWVWIQCALCDTHPHVALTVDNQAHRRAELNEVPPRQSQLLPARRIMGGNKRQVGDYFLSFILTSLMFYH